MSAEKKPATWPLDIYEAFRKTGIRQVAYVPDGGHATLIRAREAVRREVEVFQPQAPALEKLSRGLKEVFDPQGLLNPGRMYQTM